MRSNRLGFTLIEIMVVLCILSITLGFALLRFGDFGASRQVVMTSEQFVQDVKALRYKAILQDTTFGIRINPTNYQLYRFKEPSSWVLFKQIQLNHSIIMQLKTTIISKKIPQIIISPSGDMTPFQLSFGLERQSAIATLTGHDDGTVVLQS